MKSKRYLKALKYIDNESIDKLNEILSEDIFSYEKHYKHKKHQGIYFLFQDLEIVYIGISVDIISRIIHHSKLKSFQQFSFKELEIEEAKIWERILINKHKPKYNIDSITKKLRQNEIQYLHK